MSTLVQVLTLGLAQGSLYALIALGYTMVYGIIELINFAHGDGFMVGAFVSLLCVQAVFGAGVSTMKVSRALKRDELPEDLTGTLIFLASADSDFITGQMIAVDGGNVNT